MELALCIDKNVLEPCGVVIKSVCENNQNETINFHILTDNSITEEHKGILRDIILGYEGKKINFYLVDNSIMDNYPNTKNHATITKVTYYRLFLADILSPTIEKVIYLDSDIIVRKSLLPLWNTDLNNCPLAAVCDMDEQKEEKYQRLDYDPKWGYFNAGILALNLAYWRENKITQKCMDFISEHPEKIIQHDQDVLNYVLHEQRKPLSMRYNFQNGFMYKTKKFEQGKYAEDLALSLQDPVIVHYTCDKPWKENCDNPLRSLYFIYRNMTIWKDKPLIKEKRNTSYYWKKLMLTLHLHKKRQYINISLKS